MRVDIVLQQQEVLAVIALALLEDQTQVAALEAGVEPVVDEHMRGRLLALLVTQLLEESLVEVSQGRDGLEPAGELGVVEVGLVIGLHFVVDHLVTAEVLAKSKGIVVL